MARHTPLTSLHQISEINLTPLMDLTFILLITFIITFPLIEQWIPVDLPDGKAESSSLDNAMTISIDNKGVIYLDNNPVAFKDLEETMIGLGKSAPSTTVMVRADERIEYANVMRVLKLLYEAKLTKMALVTESEEG